MDIKDSYLHGTVGVVKSISVNADKLTYRLADQANTPIEVTLPTATKSANGLLSSTDKTKLDSLNGGSSYQNLVTVINSGSETVVYKKVTITKNDLDGYGIWIHSRSQHYLLNSGAIGMTAIKNTFWELGTNINSTAVSTTSGIRVKMVATSSSATVTLYIAMEAYTYFQVISSGIIKVEDSTKDIYDGITSATTGWVSCTPAKWSDTTYNIVSNSANGLAPKVINTNTATVGSAYYLLASSNGSSAPSWYKLPATAFSNDDTKVTLTNTTTSASYRVLFSSTADDTTRTAGARKSVNLQFNPSTGKLTSVIFDGGLSSYASNITNAYKPGKSLVWFPHIGHVNNFAGGESGFPATNNANGVLWLGTHANEADASALGYGHQLGFSNNKRIYHRAFYTNMPDTANGDSWYKIAYTSDNFPSNQIDKLTGYTKPTTALSALNTSDTLNQALGKLELKADLGITVYNWYLSITEEDTDSLVNKWGEIVDFLDSVKEGTDITDEFVTRKTNLTITGVKRFANSLYTLNNIYGNDDKEIIHANNDYFELGKGYSDVTTWFNGKEYKFNVGNITQAFIISKEGNVGIGDVGGAPAYKLHVGGGEIMADTVHAWSGGFKKNGSSDSYVLLGGGGHKHITTFFTSLSSDSTNAISITIGGTTKNISKATLASSLGSLKNPYSIKFKNIENTEVSYDGSSVVDLTGGLYYAKIAGLLNSTVLITNKKFTSLTNASWTDTGYTFTELESGTYAIQVTSTNLVASGIMSVYTNIEDSIGDEIPLHVYGTAGWRPYLRTSAKKLLISSNDVEAAKNGRTVTIKIAKIL